MTQKSNTRPGEETSADNHEPRPGTERYRDEKRQDHGPVAAGQKDWKLMDERGDRRFGVTRADDSDPLVLIGRSHGPEETKGNNDDDESPAAADEELAAAEANAEIESGGQRAGMSRGEEPHKAKRREKGGR